MAFGLAFGEFPSATVAEISSLRDGAPISWRARAPKAGENATADVGPLGPTTLILYRGATGHVIGAAGQAFNP